MGGAHHVSGDENMTATSPTPRSQRTRALRRPEAEAWNHLYRTFDFVHGQVRDRLKEYEISLPQYEALCILRAAGPDGLPSLEVASRMVTRVPDITRLLDRLVAANWITRTRSKDDRRVVLCKLRRKGLELLGRIDQPMTTLHKRILRHFSQAEITQLTRLLKKVRALEEQ